MKAGGTIQGMMSMLEEFKANVVGIGVLVESTDIEERLINNFVSLIRLSEVDVKEKAIQVEKGNYALAPFDKGLVEAE